MGILYRLIPRPARIDRHPIGYTRKRLTPRPIRKVERSLHPVATALAKVTAPRKRRRNWWR